ncbi:TlpA family protein disulfide reductase [Elongatibacter sediminis]|uniref:TlpA disulfide reductase family protein n=1 Tax=Elongatibacter sediminis TaxID=3119006 RepID=A0AAW9RH74_9GAMM
MNPRVYVFVLLVAVLAGFGGAAAYRMITLPDRDFSAPPADGAGRAVADPARAAAGMVGEPRPDYTLADRDGQFVNAADFDGGVVLVNFWATWCKPCREEMPMLAELYRTRADQGLEIVGIALDDVAAARDFAAELGIEYPILIGSTDVMAVVRLYGNVSGALPYSVLIDRDGLIRWTYAGELDEAELVRRVDALLEAG